MTDLIKITDRKDICRYLDLYLLNPDNGFVPAIICKNEIFEGAVIISAVTEANIKIYTLMIDAYQHQVKLEDILHLELLKLPNDRIQRKFHENEYFS